MAFFEASDALELAMNIETNGEAFYRAVTQKTQVAEVKELFEDLAEQEVKHYAVFQKLSQAFKDQALISAAEWDQYQEYLQATVQSALFEGPDRALAAAEEAKDETEAVRVAMGFEKETLLFFYNLRDLVPDRNQKTIDHIIDEEKSHLRRLAKML
jgi:rubrerythrin